MRIGRSPSGATAIGQIRFSIRWAVTLWAMVAGAAALSACDVSAYQEAVEWSQTTRRSLTEQGVRSDVIDCVVNLAARDLQRGPLDAPTTDEALRICRDARFVLDGIEGNSVPDIELALTDVAWTFGDDPELDRLWTDCEQGSGVACDQLFEQSPVGSDYEDFGVSCGRRPDVLHCSDLDSAVENSAE